MEDKKLISNFEKSNEYRNVIHDLIPGGAHTYSKGDDQFPLNSPAAITHGKGAYVWDLDGNKFFDTLMGLTSVSLGHAYEPVLERVREELLKGSNFSRPSVIEYEMANRFLSLVPQHDMIKYAKNGSVVTTAAIKLAPSESKIVAVDSITPSPKYFSLTVKYTLYFLLNGLRASRISSADLKLYLPKELKRDFFALNSC